MFGGIGDFFEENIGTIGGTLLGGFPGQVAGSYLDAGRENRQARDAYNQQISNAIAQGMAQGEAQNQALYGPGYQSQIQGGVQDLIAQREADLNAEDPASTQYRQTGSRRVAGARSRASQRGRQLSAGEEAEIKRQGDLDAAIAMDRKRQQSLANYQSMLNNMIGQSQAVKFGYANLQAAPLQAPLPRQGGISGLFERFVG